MSSSGQATSHSPVRIDRYIAIVNMCADTHADKDIANGNALHARYLIEKLFRVANSSVGIITGCLRQSDPDGVAIYAHPPVIEAAREFLRKEGSKLTIVVQSGEVDGGQDENAFVKAVAADTGRAGEFEILVARPGSIDDAPHCMIADKSAYRLELGAAGDDNIAAIANFGNPGVAASLADYFRDVVAYLRGDSHLVSDKQIGAVSLAA